MLRGLIPTLSCLCLLLAAPARAASLPKSIAIGLPPAGTTTSMAWGIAVEDTGMDAKTGPFRNVSFSLQFPNGSSSALGSVAPSAVDGGASFVAQGCPLYPGSTYSFYPDSTQSGTFTLTTTVIYGLGPEGKCATPFTYQTVTAVDSFTILSNTTAYTATNRATASPIATTVTYASAPTGSYVSGGARLTGSESLGTAGMAVLFGVWLLL